MSKVYGDTHVEPEMLFDPTREAPPADAFDVYFTTPLSLSLLGDAYAHHGMQRELDILLNLYAGLAGDVVKVLQRQGGYVEAAHLGSPPVPARLQLAALAHNAVPGEPTMRLHLHVYVGRTAPALDTKFAPGTGRSALVDRMGFGRAIDDAWGRYLTAIERETSRALGVTWGPVPGRSTTEQEIVEPPLMEHVAGHELGVCPGDFGPREQVMADAGWRALAEDSARPIAREQRRTG